MSFRLAVPRKKWQIATVANTLQGTTLDDQRAVEILLKNQRKAFGHIVAGSSNGTSGAMDGVDRINSNAEWICKDGQEAPPTRKSWIVLTQPGSGSQDLIAIQQDNLGGLTSWLRQHSPAGLFVGGSATAYPTATDVTTIYNNTFYGRNTTDDVLVEHLWVAEDLTCFRQVSFCANAFYNILGYDQAVDPVSGWNVPNYAWFDQGASFDRKAPGHVPGLADLLMNEIAGAGTGIFKGWGPHGAMQMTGVLEGSGISQTAGRSAPLPDVNTAKNKISGYYDDPPRMKLFCNPSQPDGGKHGEVPDIWFVPNVFPAGATTPLNGAKDFIMLGNQMHPWNGTAPRTS